MIEITFLGTGTSQGIPVIACQCSVCLSKNKKDKRLRSSVLISISNLNIVIDTGPDFRQQMLRENVQKLDAVFYTHEHKDHLAGLDDVRAFNFKQKKDMPLYATQRVSEAIKHEFHYAFSKNPYPGIPKLRIHEIDNTPFKIKDIKIIPIKGLHHKLPVLGFRIMDFTYLTDMNSIEPLELNKIKGSKILVINALRKEKHISHFNVEEALEIIEKIKPKKAYLTHISHLYGLHETENVLLPQNVEIAYDGLSINL